jgi:hypothetical protein
MVNDKVEAIQEAKPESPVIDEVAGQSTVETMGLEFNKVIIFCPKFFMSPDRENELLRKGIPVEKKPTPNVVRDMFKKMWWSIKRNEMKMFEKDVGEYLLIKFGFLIRVMPHEIDKYRKIQADKEYKCHVCAAEKKVFETDTLVAYKTHMKAHNLSPEAQAMISSMESAQPDGMVRSAQDMIEGRQPQVDPYAGAPVGGTYDRPMVDGDGVEWVGPGSVKSHGMKLRPKFGAAGVFRGGAI